MQEAVVINPRPTTERLKYPQRNTMHHLERNMPAIAHTAMYNWHKYWARKTWNIVGAFVENYCPEDGLVLDPFSGSGVTAIEALRRGRRAIAVDLSPIANNILLATVTRTNLLELRDAFDRVGKRVKDNISSFYMTECRRCHEQIEFDCMIWENGKPREVRYRCPNCGDRQEAGCTLLDSDRTLLAQIEQTSITLPYPNQPLYYRSGRPFKEKQKYESLDQMFTHRNLLALGACPSNRTEEI
jgi:hypothetical protein